MENVEPVAMATKEHSGVWLEDLDDEADEEDFHLLYNTYSGDDMIYSDSKVNLHPLSLSQFDSEKVQIYL